MVAEALNAGVTVPAASTAAPLLNSAGLALGPIGAALGTHQMIEGIENNEAAMSFRAGLESAPESSRR